jgi:RND family efflux transporter MFP subunit
MKRPGKKWIILSLVIVALAVGGYFWFNKSDKTQYVLADVTRGQIVQTVSVTGSVKADPTINLHFKQSGEVKEIDVKEGERIKKGQLLASLENKSLDLEIKRNNANLTYAQAEYNQLKAGTKSEEIQIAEADVKSAQSAYDASVTDLENTKSVGRSNIELAQIAYKQSQDNASAAEKDLATTKLLAENEIAKLKLGGKNESTIELESAYANAKTAMATTLGVMQDSMFLAAKIIGTNDLGTNDIPSGERYKFNTSLNTTATADLKAANDLYSSLTFDATNEEIDAAMTATIRAGNSVSALLVFLGSQLQSILYYGPAIGNWITQVTTQSTSLSTSLSSLNDISKTIQNLQTGTVSDTETLILNYQRQIDTAENAYATAVNSQDKAEFDLEQSKTNAQNSEKNAQAQVSIKESAKNAAAAALNLKKSPVRSVDLAPFAAQITLAKVAQEIAQTQYADSQLIAPIDGVVAFIYGKVGENVSLSEVSLSAFLTIQADNLIVEANVPETDVSKIKPGDKAEMTIDAFDFSEKFEGGVVYIDPAETMIQGVVYYQIKTAFDLKDERLKPGMTTNLNIVTAQKDNVLIIPARAVKYEDSIRYVEVLDNNGAPKKVTIKTGLESDQFVEVTDGLKEGDKIITFAQ